jgi:predicted ATPase/transcriptional regulator with XRE-family HTH domain
MSNMRLCPFYRSCGAGRFGCSRPRHQGPRLGIAGQCRLAVVWVLSGYRFQVRGPRSWFGGGARLPLCWGCSAREARPSVSASGAEPEPFGAQLRQLRVRAGLSREELAERSGVSVPTILALELGRRRQPHPHTLATLAEALGLAPVERAALLESGPRREPAAMSPGRHAQRGGRGLDGRIAAGSMHNSPSEISSLPTSQPTTPAPAQPEVNPPTLPIWLTPLVGREVELEAARAVLDPSSSAVRLLTLIGPGGVGKTRLAVAVAAGLSGAYQDGVMFIDLTPLHDPRLVAATVARALGLQETGGRSARELLLGHLRERHLLLLLDNMEHLLGATPLLTELLRACPRVALMVTSRTALRLQGEQRFSVAPLATPTVESDQDESVITSPAVRLFVQRARAIASDFALDAANAAAVAGVCRRLDGMPLAIELAAARVSLLSPEGLLRRLERSLPLLTGGAPDLPARQQTLRGALAWSYDLLAPTQQTLFRRVAVFVGGWTLDAAEAVCADAELPADDVLDQLQSLVDSSLIRPMTEAGDEPRFGMLETVREYAAERLAEGNDSTAMRARQRDWCLSLVERMAPEELDQDHVAKLDREQDNLRAALRWTIECRDAEAGLRLGIGCWPLWYLRGLYTEGRMWLAEVLRLTDNSHRGALRSRALAFAGHLAYCEGDMASATALLGEGLTTAEAASDAQGIGMGAHFLGNVARLHGDLIQAQSHYERALAVARQTGGRAWETMAVVLLAQVLYERDDGVGARARVAEAMDLCARQDHPQARARALVLSARLAALAGDHSTAEMQFEVSLRLMRQLRDQQGQAWGHLLAGHAALDRGDRADAAQHLADALTIAHATHDQPALVRGLEGVARLLATSEPALALRMVASTADLRRTLSLALAPIDRRRLMGWLADARAALGYSAEQVRNDDPAPSIATVLVDALAACRMLTGTPAGSPAATSK